MLDDSDSDDGSSVGEVDMDFDMEEVKANSSSNKGSRPGVKRTNSSGSVAEGTIEERLANMMALKDDLDVEACPDYQAKEAARRAKEEEEARLAAMSPEDRVKLQQEDVGDLMSKIRLKRQNSMSNDKKMATTGKGGRKKGSKAAAGANSGDDDDEQDMAEFRRLKARKQRSKRKLMERAAVACA